MNIALIAATFAVIVPAELPDKTFISAIILSSRYKPFPVWVGAATGLVLQAGIAVVAGRLLAYAPHRIVELVVAILFLGGAAFLLLKNEDSAEEEGEKLANKEGEAEKSNFRIALMTFGIVAAAEFGDLTQVVTANLSAKFNDPWSVFIGASLGFLFVSAAGVAVGRTLTRYVPLKLVRKISGFALLGLGIWSSVSAATG